jgi:hypothetical protein
MPPRFAFWTILLDGQPTAFRARKPEELLPTLKQLQSTSPGAIMRWFSHGKLWASPEEALEARARRPATEERRGAEWRPGGKHQDPRDRFKRDGAAASAKQKPRPERRVPRDAPARPGHPARPGRPGRGTSPSTSPFKKR